MLPVVPVRIVRLGALCVLITVTVLITSYMLMNRHHGIDDKLELLAFTDNGTAYALHDTLTPSWTTEQLVPRFAYVQYATNLEYLCNALINFTLLRRYGAQHDLVLIHPEKWTQGTSRQGVIREAAKRPGGTELVVRDPLFVRARADIRRMIEIMRIMGDGEQGSDVARTRVVVLEEFL
ncbi:hypothetical protein BN1723_000804 [Verticillium longisporum]|uniref:Uncharacterized protein n=1 Tax=Verticillium longisporum TaxID=100787 RepID=A0A0G4N7Y6_VERLO|nr:hypothetical protein BN1723_000804 [Verticillium longisporum]